MINLVINFCLVVERGGKALLQIYVQLLGKLGRADDFFVSAFSQLPSAQNYP